MDEYPLISIIVPVYNVEAYLDRCVNSIRKQTYSNLEIILIDDGSTDNCGILCDKYAEEDNRIVVIHKENGGLSDARNIGLNIMKGEFVSCIDSDDFVSPYFIENLFLAIKNSNCPIAGSWFVEYHDEDILPTAERVNLNDVQILNREELYTRMLYQDGVEVSAWGKLYKSDFFADVRYPIGKLYEDIPTTYRLFEKAEYIAIIPNVDYYYFQRNNSIAQTKFYTKKMDAVVYMNALKDFLTEHYPSLKCAAECRYFSTVCNILFQIHDKEFEIQRKQLWNEVKKYRKNVTFDRFGRKKARLAALSSYAGYHVMSFLYHRTQHK